jgi:8-oxo-dGTP pyrophosphatase MutT (NUDIX family)
MMRDEKRQAMKAPSLDALIDSVELESLERRFGQQQRWHAVIEMGSANFQYWWRKIVEKVNRRGEVVFALQRSDGKVLVHTKSIYPAQFYRLPSGGIHPGESVLDGLQREVFEETGLTPMCEQYLGIVSYEFRHRGQPLYFVSYVFLLQTDDRYPQPQDTTETISDLRYVSLDDLRRIARDLRQLSAGWSDWGEFRAPPHDMVIEALAADDIGVGITER